MEPNKVAPKTLVAVLASHIKENAETMAKTIVEKCKGNDIDYQMLIENYILKKDEAEPEKIILSKVAEQLFNEFKDTPLFKKFYIEILHEWEKSNGGEIVKDDAVYKIRLETEEKVKSSFSANMVNLSVMGTGSNFFKALETFRTDYKNTILNRKGVTETIIDEKEEKKN